MFFSVIISNVQRAGVAQWQSSWFVISRLLVRLRSPAPYGGFPERPKGADCKSVVTDFGGPNPPSPTRKKHCFRSAFFNDVCLRQMMLATPMMTAPPNDVCLTAHNGKHRIIATNGSNIIFAKQMHHIAAGDASFDNQAISWYNSPKRWLLCIVLTRLINTNGYISLSTL